MKRYILFGSYSFGSSGGMHDFIIDTDTLEEAKEKCIKDIDRVGNRYPHCRLYHIWDCVERRIVCDCIAGYDNENLDCTVCTLWTEVGGENK